MSKIKKFYLLIGLILGVLLLLACLPNHKDGDTEGKSHIVKSSLDANISKEMNNDQNKEFNEMFVFKDPKGNPVAGFAYKFVTSDGKVFRGISNEKGETILVSTGNESKLIELYADDD
ncbi:hypothetical protein [uncultured Acinetobacter sp.]|uniref:hypothetical protein n=1 Tax=uncultured Acinetobacter sp. TaxID=165433 RepID=UPI0025854400|nr:hypothetical protein [uncultured Acinetobacter sp.]